ncbi:hypothetical protein C8F01DRAFT_1361360 [Mycena amicta]|nr:hypothetical protein C8F01DRAFT_1361360 [Mycena amicta]
MSNSSSQTSFAPPGESSYDLWVEKSNLDGFVLSGVGYGILSTIAFNTLALFIKRKPGRKPRSKDRGLIAYVVIMFLLATVAFATNAKFNEMQYIDERAIPGGPNAFSMLYYNSFFNMFAFIAYIIMGWMTNGLMLWRFLLIWGNNYWLALFPAVMLLGIVTSSLLLVTSLFLIASPFWAAQTVRFGICYWSLSISLNTILTLGIIIRILVAGRHIQDVLGEDHSKRYVSIAAMLIESAALYAIWSLVFLICYARNTPLQNILLSSLGQVQGIAPLLILFRVAQGRAWTQDTANATGPLTFERPRDGSRSFQIGDLSQAASLSERGDSPLYPTPSREMAEGRGGGGRCVKISIVTDPVYTRSRLERSRTDWDAPLDSLQKLPSSARSI